MVRQFLTRYNDKMIILPILGLEYVHFGAGDAGVCIYRLEIKISIHLGLLTLLLSMLLKTHFC